MAEPRALTTLVDWLDDLTVRFLLNLPASELSSMPRLCFQVEEAQWFYEDFVRPAVAALGAPPLPHLTLKQFCLLLFQHCPLLSGFTDAQHLAAYEEFLAYKVRVPVRGAILLDQSMEKVVLVRGWKKNASWSFPRGKINKDEKDLDCAIREAWEETGFDLRAEGLVSHTDNEMGFIDITMREQHMRLFVFRNVPDSARFEPQTRKEIGKIQWYNIRDLPGFKRNNKQREDEISSNKFYMVAPFLGPLKRWINLQRKNGAKVGSNENHERAATAGHAMQPVLNDDNNGEMSDAVAPVFTEQQSEELKRLLSLNSSNTRPTPPANQTPDLLALRRGGGQTNGAIPSARTERELPMHRQSSHPEQNGQPQTSMQWQGPLSHPHLPYPVMTAGHTGLRLPSQSSSFPSSSGRTWSRTPNTAMPSRMPYHSSVSAEKASQEGQRISTGLRQPSSNHYAGFAQSEQRPSLHVAHGSQSMAGNGSVVPLASQIPLPRVDAHSMKLLHAFKSGSEPEAPHPAHNSTGLAQATEKTHHQAALLDLFRQQPSPATPASTRPGLDTVAPVMEQKKVKLNEITRTLPSYPMSKSPSARQMAPQPRLQDPQSSLLDIFHSKSKRIGGTPPIRSPAMPISPFRLGTPARAAFHSERGTKSSRTRDTGASNERARPVNSQENAHTNATTPADAKNFLVGYLNGIVSQEGSRS